MYTKPSFSSTARKTEIDGRFLREITTLFGTPVPPALSNDHENTTQASKASALRPILSKMRLGAGVQLAFVLVDSAKDRNRRAILRKITTLFGTLVPTALPNDLENTLKVSRASPYALSLERNAPSSGRTVSLYSHRQRERPKF